MGKWKCTSSVLALLRGLLCWFIDLVNHLSAPAISATKRLFFFSFDRKNISLPESEYATECTHKNISWRVKKLLIVAWFKVIILSESACGVWQCYLDIFTSAHRRLENDICSAFSYWLRLFRCGEWEKKENEHSRKRTHPGYGLKCCHKTPKRNKINGIWWRISSCTNQSSSALLLTGIGEAAAVMCAWVELMMSEEAVKISREITIICVISVLTFWGR